MSLKWYIAIAVAVIVAAGAFLLSRPPRPEIANADYSSAEVACAGGNKPGPAGVTDDRYSEKGIRYYVRTPKNYDATIAHPLVLVLTPGTSSGLTAERYLGDFTTTATEAGYIVAYADNRSRKISFPPVSIESILEQGTVPKLVASEWCVDTDRIYLTGHSNGGTASVALSVLENSPISPAAIAASAAGFTSKDLSEFKCPGTKPVMILHSRNDRLFPGYGTQIASWWAACNRCTDRDAAVKAAGHAEVEGDRCYAFEGCAAPTVYCVGSAGHGSWPGRNHEIIDFFSSAKN